jgi:hypothetical protein
MSKLSDTSPEIERLLTQIYRRRTPAEKWLRLGEMYQDARALHAAGVRLRNPKASAREILRSWLRDNLGYTQLEAIGEPAMDQSNPNLRELRRVVAVFDQLGILTALGGSLASSIYGIERFTNDGDITAEPFPGKEGPLAAAFHAPYYVSLPAIEEAVRLRSTFNILHTSSGFKVDVFVRTEEPFERTAMSRRMTVQIPDVAGGPSAPIIVHSPEDVILFKLRWYRLGNEISEHQWNDVLGMFRAQGKHLDQSYLDRWAVDLKVDDLLRRVREEADATSP